MERLHFVTAPIVKWNDLGLTLSFILVILPPLPPGKSRHNSAKDEMRLHTKWAFCKMKKGYAICANAGVVLFMLDFFCVEGEWRELTSSEQKFVLFAIGFSEVDEVFVAYSEGRNIFLVLLNELDYTNSIEYTGRFMDFLDNNDINIQYALLGMNELNKEESNIIAHFTQKGQLHAKKRCVRGFKGTQ